MDDIIKDVNEGWDEEGQRTQFRGSDDYLRQKVNECWHATVTEINLLIIVRGVHLRSSCIDQACRLHCEG